MQPFQVVNKDVATSSSFAAIHTVAPGFWHMHRKFHCCAAGFFRGALTICAANRMSFFRDALRGHIRLWWKSWFLISFQMTTQQCLHRRIIWSSHSFSSLIYFGCASAWCDANATTAALASLSCCKKWRQRPWWKKNAAPPRLAILLEKCRGQHIVYPRHVMVIKHFKFSIILTNFH